MVRCVLAFSFCDMYLGGKFILLVIKPDTVGGIVFKRPYAGSGWAGEAKLSSPARRVFRRI